MAMRMEPALTNLEGTDWGTFMGEIIVPEQVCV